MTFGPTMDKSNILGLARDTAWNGFLELNRLAFSEALPRNSESRLAVPMRMIKKHYPHIEWVISFADGCQCGDRTIYRATGFVLTGIKLNKSLLRLSDGSVTHKMTQVTGKNRAAHFAKTGGSWSGQGVPLDGYQMRYIYFLNPDARARLACKEIPYAEIERRGAGMYRGIARGKQALAEAPLVQRRGSGDRHAPF